MLFALIALVIMLIGAAALVRSSTTSLAGAGNLGFKRDLANQAERATRAALALMQGSGALAGETAREADAVAHNYKATMLPSNAQGIPNALLGDAGFSAVGNAANDIAVADQGVTVRYVVDRLCANNGSADESHCTMSDNGQPSGCSSNPCDDLSSAVPRQPVYRLSVRVTGPRRTQAYFQTTFTL